MLSLSNTSGKTVHVLVEAAQVASTDAARTNWLPSPSSLWTHTVGPSARTPSFIAQLPPQEARRDNGLEAVAVQLRDGESKEIVMESSTGRCSAALEAGMRFTVIMDRAPIAAGCTMHFSSDALSHTCQEDPRCQHAMTISAQSFEDALVVHRAHLGRTLPLQPVEAEMTMGEMVRFALDETFEWFHGPAQGSLQD